MITFHFSRLNNIKCFAYGNSIWANAINATASSLFIQNWWGKIFRPVVNKICKLLQNQIAKITIYNKIKQVKSIRKLYCEKIYEYWILTIYLFIFITSLCCEVSIAIFLNGFGILYIHTYTYIQCNAIRKIYKIFSPHSYFKKISFLSLLKLLGLNAMCQRILIHLKSKLEPSYMSLSWGSSNINYVFLTALDSFRNLCKCEQNIINIVDVMEKRVSDDKQAVNTLWVFSHFILMGKSMWKLRHLMKR